jgi:hypothetical protein
VFDFSIPAGQGVPTGGTINQVLQKNSSTNYDTSWVTLSGGGGGQMEGSAVAKAIFWNAQSIAENITIVGTHNGWTVGPVTVDNGFAVTVSNGARWVVF